MWENYPPYEQTRAGLHGFDEFEKLNDEEKCPRVVNCDSDVKIVRTYNGRNVFQLVTFPQNILVKLLYFRHNRIGYNTHFEFFFLFIFTRIMKTLFHVFDLKNVFRTFRFRLI